jgi:hypothetical protein
MHAEDWSGVRSWTRRIVASARSQGCENLLLSSEWLLGSAAESDRLSHLESVLRDQGATQIKFLLILRDPVNQLISLYKHRAKNGTAGSIDAWIADGYDLPGSLTGLRRQIESGKVNLAVRRYGKETGSLEGLFFRDWLGIAIPAGAENFRVNPSLSLSELVLLRQLSAHHPGLVPYLYNRLLEIPSEQKREGRDLAEHAHRVAVRAVARDADEWASWNDLLPSDERFDIPEPGPEPGAEPNALELSAEQLSAVMQLLGDALSFRLRLQVLWSWRLRPVLARIKQMLFPRLSRR